MVHLMHFSSLLICTLHFCRSVFLKCTLYFCRSLQVYVQTGRTHSAILREQRSADGGSELGGPLRYPYACILWLQCDQVWILMLPVHSCYRC
jgi:hypothetical protein